MIDDAAWSSWSVIPVSDVVTKPLPTRSRGPLTAFLAGGPPSSALTRSTTPEPAKRGAGPEGCASATLAIVRATARAPR
ncbi:hypothetical protein [Spirillospora sp. NPDC047279]|uniref:hypothetical protein n=1 Tax=Spirillospora sp. NPDC047279 TaxID=3155478 RepID=UPI0033DC055D